MATPEVKIGKMENAPEWYGKPLEQQHFEWSKEEELMLERWCEKIAKNCEEEEMTPMQRYRATWEKKPKDRLHIEVKYNVPYAVRTLDSFADAIRPGDLYKRPKLHIMGHLATAARFKLDIINIYVIHYTEECWGADGRMIDYGTPQQVGQPPIKTWDDVNSVLPADPKKHSLYPGYLWAAKEIKRIMKKYGVADKLPVELSYCGDPLGTAFLGMVGFGPGTIMMKKEPELFKAVMEKAAAFQLSFGKACKETGPDGLYMCSFMGSFPPKLKNVDNEWIMELYAKLGRGVAAHQADPSTFKTPGQVGENQYMWHTLGANGWEQWMPLYAKNGAVGVGSYGGWWVGWEMPYADVFAHSREHDLYCGCTIDDHIVLDGNLPAMEEALTPRVNVAKQYPKHFCALGVIDYWTPQPVFEKLMEMAKRLGKF